MCPSSFVVPVENTVAVVRKGCEWHVFLGGGSLREVLNVKAFWSACVRRRRDSDRKDDKNNTRIVSVLVQDEAAGLVRGAASDDDDDDVVVRQLCLVGRTAR